MSTRNERARAARDLMAQRLSVDVAEIQFVCWRELYKGDNAVVVRIKESLWVADPYVANGTIGIKCYPIQWRRWRGRTS